MRTHDREDGAKRPISTGERSESTGFGALSTVEKSETIADCVDVDRIASELPEQWTVKPDLVQSASEPLAETLLFRRSITEPQLSLRPADPTSPRKHIEFHERHGPHATSRRTMTVDRLSEAVRVAVNRVHQFER